ncbi:MAG: PHP domain-containing protein [Sphaerochaetaceae bacterium]|jgi:PHP family Zn ribbon phosphoesterase
MQLKVDLHNHSCLSPCASNNLAPPVLAYEAYEKGLDIVALSDHNSGRNLPAFSEACQILGLVGVYGVEVTTIEEVHLLALFASLEEGEEFSAWIESLLPKNRNVASKFGHQLVCDVMGNVVEEVDLFLYGAANISFDNLTTTIVQRGGLAIPAHIDRPINSVIANLGFLPPLPYSAVEVVNNPPRVATGEYCLIRSSDAHSIRDVATRFSTIEATTRDFKGLKEALQHKAVIL